MGGLVVRLVGWFVDWLAYRLVGRSIGRVVGWLADWSAGRLVG